MANVANAPTGKKIGTTAIGATAGATVGSQLGFALADVIVEVLASVNVDLAAVENSLGIVISALVAVLTGLLAGKFVPTNQVREAEPVVIPIPVAPGEGGLDPFEGNEDASAAGGSTAAHPVEDSTLERPAA